MKKSMHLAALAVLSVAASAAFAGPQESRDLLANLVQCKAPMSDAVKFNDLLDNQQVGLPKLPDSTSFMGSSWKVAPVISTLGVSSDVGMINGRHSFFVIVPSSHPKADVKALAQREGLEVTLDMDADAMAQKPAQDRTYQAYTLDKTHYVAGCDYDENAFTHARQAHANASPGRIALKKQLLDILARSR